MTDWNKRFGQDGYIFGTAPNAWLAAQAPRIRPGGRVLSLGEGEGRNAVWLAERGLSVEGVDGSSVGQEKARALARSRGVEVTWTLASLESYEPARGAYDAVVLIFLHLFPELRRRVHGHAQAALAPGGVVIVEAFTPGQRAYASGGPPELERTYTPAVLRADFPEIAWDVLEETVTELDEGRGHAGPGAVVRGVGRKGDHPVR